MSPSSALWALGLLSLLLPLLSKGTISKLLNSNSHLWSSFLLLFAAEFGSLLSEQPQYDFLAFRPVSVN